MLKWLVPEKKKHKMSLEHLVVTRGKEVVKNDGSICQKHTRANVKEFQWPNLEQFEE